ncbi:MAG TPA: type IV pilus biogenesis/stability protein PilW [Rhodanobacteraceae bacterium]|jgi:type IV pilus assembly protein PilF|nr:type IV pilus biogenesis/stability protein PilW [Rhodanobacteraceae bacterium]
MQLKTGLLFAAMALTLGLAACKHNPGIIKYPTPMSNLKNSPHESKAEDKQHAAQVHTQLAAAYMKQNDLKEAEVALHKAIGFDDKYIPAHTMLAILEWHIGRLQDADKEFRGAIAIDPSNGDTNNNYGQFLCAQDKQKDALRYFQRALADPFYKYPATANTNAGNCLLKGNDYAGAEPYLSKALELDSNYGPALLAMAELDYRKGDAFHARGYLQRFEGAGSATPESLLLGYQIATRLGDKETATSYSTRLQDQFPNSAQAKSMGSASQ